MSLGFPVALLDSLDPRVTNTLRTINFFVARLQATDNKYDRQLRLWGKDGQLRLAEANVCVLGAGPTATETLKNLVLPGLGRFTLVDGGTVAVTDLGNNFFLTTGDLGRPRAEAARDWLVEMNPDDCVGAARVADPADLLASEPTFFNDFSLVRNEVYSDDGLCFRHNRSVKTN